MSFEILDVIDNDEGCFYALLPTFDDPQDEVDSEGTYYIFEAIEEDGEQQLAEVEDEELLDRLAEIFESILKSFTKRKIRKNKLSLPGAWTCV